MAQLVLGIGMSHSTMVTLDDSLWGEWAAQDSTFAILYRNQVWIGFCMLVMTVISYGGKGYYYT